MIAAGCEMKIASNDEAQDPLRAMYPTPTSIAAPSRPRHLETCRFVKVPILSRTGHEAAAAARCSRPSSAMEDNNLVARGVIDMNRAPTPTLQTRPGIDVTAATRAATPALSTNPAPGPAERDSE